MNSRGLALMIFFLLLVVPAAFAADTCTFAAPCPGGVSDEVLASYPQPDVIPLQIKDSVIYDRIYRKVLPGMHIYDAPGGSLTATTGKGFSYVTLKEIQGDWARIDANQWVQQAQLSEDVLVSRFGGVRLPEEGLPYPMAWTLKHLRASRTPGGEPAESNPFLYRYTRVTLYAWVEVDGYRWYQIGKNQWVHQFNVAKIAPIERPAEVDTHKWIGIDLYEQVAIAYEGDTPVFATLVSSGLPGWDTNEGLFHIYMRYERTTMSGAYQQPDFYSLHEVPWTMYFDGDIALHGTYWHDGFGYRASHGCVNLSITDAKWLYEWSADERDFTSAEPLDAAVYVYYSGDYTT